MTEIEESARLLIAEATRALASGTKHYNKAGEELTTVVAILRCLQVEGAITFKSRQRDGCG